MRAVLRGGALGLGLVASTALASPAHAGSSVRALWDKTTLPTMVDSAGGDNNGTTVDVTLVGGGLYRFNGTTSLARVPDRANLDPGQASVRLTARVEIAARPAPGETFDIVRKGVATTAGGDYKMEVLTTSNGAVANCSFKDAGRVSARIRGTVDLLGKGLQTITCVKTPTSVQVSAAGQTRTSRKALGRISNDAPVFVGGKGDGTDAFAGTMDVVKIEIG